LKVNVSYVSELVLLK